MSGTVRKLVAAGALAVSMSLSVPVSTGLFSPAQAAEPAMAAKSPVSSVRPEVEAPFPRAASAENAAPWGLLGLFGLLGLLGLARRAPAPRTRQQENFAEDPEDPFARYRTAQESSPEDNPTLYPNAAATEYRQGGRHHAGPYPPQQAPPAPRQAPQQAPQPASQQWPQRETDWHERESAPAEAGRQEHRPVPPQPPQQPQPQAQAQPQGPARQRPHIVQPGPDSSWQRPEPHPADAATWHADHPHGEDPRPDWFGEPRNEPPEAPRHDDQAPSRSATSALHDDWSYEDPEPPDDAGFDEGRRHRF